MVAVPLFNLAPQLSVSRLCFGSSSSTSPSLFHFPFALNHELNPCRTLLRNHDIRRAELPLRIISPPRPSLRCRNQLLRLRGNVFLPSPSDVISRRISFSRVSMIAFCFFFVSFFLFLFVGIQFLSVPKLRDEAKTTLAVGFVIGRSPGTASSWPPRSSLLPPSKQKKFLFFCFHF